jgi:hypothetical protein
MAGVVLLTDQRADEVLIVIRPIRARDRIVARLRADHLDRQLAAGVSPDTSALLTLRARRLFRPAVRRKMTRGLRRLVYFVQGHSRAPGDATLTREQVYTAIPGLLRLADRLEAPEPLDVQGIARTRLLLTDPTGPLFYRRGADGVSAAVEQALAALTPRSASNA